MDSIAGWVVIIVKALLVKLPESVVLVLAPSEPLSEKADSYSMVEGDYPGVTFCKTSMKVAFFQDCKEVLVWLIS